MTHRPFLTLTVAVCVVMHFASHAQSLRFTGGNVANNFSTVTLTLAGPTNTLIQLQRLGRSNQVWQTVGYGYTGTNGTLTLTNSLDEGIYGYFRAQTTNGTYRSTNAFGTVAGYLFPGWSMIGNPFAANWVTNIIRNPSEGLLVYKWRNASNVFHLITHEFGTWSDTTNLVEQMEGIIVQNPATNTVRYVVQGIFSTNALTRSLPTGWSLLSSPLYKLTVPSEYRVDTLDTNRLGGFSQLPVRSPGFPLESKLEQLVGSSSYTLASYSLTNSAWRVGGVVTNIHLGLTEGFWLNKPTNATWSVSLPIW